jgi:hypothetical protein
VFSGIYAVTRRRHPPMMLILTVVTISLTSAFEPVDS